MLKGFIKIFKNMECETDPTLDYLNDDCLFLILKRLQLNERIIVERVSKRFKKLCDSLWKQQQEIHVNEKSDRLSYLSCKTTKHLEAVLNRCGEDSLKILDVSYIYDSSTLFVIGKCCPNIMHLKLSGVPFSSDGANYLSSRCKNLRRIDMEYCEGVTDDMMMPLLLANDRIQEINLRGNFLTGNFFNYVSSNIKHIEVSCSSLNNEHLMENLPRFQNLLKLNLCGCNSLKNSIVKCIVRNALQLQELRLLYNQFVNDNALQTLSTGCLRLEILDIRRCANITNNGIQALTGIVNLKTLYINHINSIDDGALLSLSGATSLRTLDCSFCELITDVGVQAVLQFCENLSHLNVNCCKLVTNRTVDEAIQVMEKRQSNLPLKLSVTRSGVLKYLIPESLPKLLTIHW